ncbi:MAG TPA: hypothetical protein VF545_05680 [Thermoleophilaceae bacterium]|jgi:TolB protein
MTEHGSRRGRTAATVGTIALVAIACGVGTAAAAPARIAFRAQGPSTPDGQTFNIFTVRSDGSDLRQVTRGQYDLAPSWSPRHSRLVFGVLQHLVGSIAIVNADGSHRRTLPHTDDGVAPDWSSKGRIVYVRPYKSGNALFTIRPNGKGFKRLTGAGRFYSAPAWSPNATRIAYVKGNAIFTMRADGSRKRRLIDDGRAPNWSPDGRRIAFQRGSNVYVALDNGTNIRRLTGGTRAGLAPAWSPGGTRIAFGGVGGGIWTMDRDGRDARQIRATGSDADW